MVEHQPKKVSEHDYGEVHLTSIGAEWIACIEKILGSASYSLTSEANPGTGHETATYYSPDRLVSKPDFDALTDDHVAITVTRPLNAGLVPFRVHVNIIKCGEQKIYRHESIGRIVTNPKHKAVLFFPLTGNGEVSEDYVLKITDDGETTINGLSPVLDSMKGSNQDFSDRSFRQPIPKRVDRGYSLDTAHRSPVDVYTTC